ncbi:MAG TPA: hypothetical protein VEQ59_08900 [Polyangiaceae bacterium]|nr:hypothetical protein [Polyangiaceae bacterium]
MIGVGKTNPSAEELRKHHSAEDIMPSDVSAGRTLSSNRWRPCASQTASSTALTAKGTASTFSKVSHELGPVGQFREVSFTALPRK